MVVGVNNNYNQYNYADISYTGKKQKQPLKKEYIIISNEQSKKTSNSNSSCLIGAGIGLGLAATILLKKGKIKEAKQLAEHIQFKEAKSIDEAINFAKTNLGVELVNIKDLNIANLINEKVVEMSNKALGKIPLPKKIQIKSITKGLAGRYNPIKDIVYLQKENTEAIARDFEILQKKKNLKFILDGYVETLYHEIGHQVQRKKIGLLRMLSPKNLYAQLNNTYKKQTTPIKKELLEYLGGNNDITDKAVLHFIDSPSETFAQTFARMMTGNTPTGKFAELYKNLGGTIY